MIKIVDTFWALYHVRWCLRMPENQILSLKPNVPFLPYWPYWKISDLFEFYTRNTSFLTFPIQGTFGLGLKIWFSGILRHHLTWYKAQKVSTILIMSPPAFLVECTRYWYQNQQHNKFSPSPADPVRDDACDPSAGERDPRGGMHAGNPPCVSEHRAATAARDPP